MRLLTDEDISRFTIEEKERIHLLVNKSKSNRKIAEAFNRSHTTIARELARFKTRCDYSPSKAESHVRKKRIILIGSKKTIAIAIRNEESLKRITGLKTHLRKLCAEPMPF